MKGRRVRMQEKRTFWACLVLIICQPSLKVSIVSFFFLKQTRQIAGTRHADFSALQRFSKSWSLAL